MTILETPLSNLIEQHSAGKSVDTAKRLLDAFLKAELGVITSGVPELEPFRVSIVEHQIDTTKLADGRVMVLAFADPEAVELQRGGKYTRILGSTLLDAADAIPSCAGVAVNSAISDRSFVVDRRIVQLFLNGRSATAPVSTPRPWWQFWAQGGRPQG